MVLETLIQHIASLGFASSLEDIDDSLSEPAFFAALNKAMYTVNEVRPRMSTFQILHRPLATAACFNSTTHCGSDVVISVSSAVSYTFDVNGNGRVTISANGGDTILETHTWTTPQTFRGYIGNRENVVVTFSGDFVYTISHFALYSEAYSANEEDVPQYREFVEYDMSTLTEDFMSLQGGKIECLDKELFQNKDYRIKQSKILEFPRRDAGNIYNVTYQRKLRQYTVDDNATANITPIDLDEDLAMLLPNLVAYYVLLDDEPAKAASYFSIFQNEKAEKTARERITTIPPVRRICDWG